MKRSLEVDQERQRAIRMELALLGIDAKAVASLPWQLSNRTLRVEETGEVWEDLTLSRRLEVKT